MKLPGLKKLSALKEKKITMTDQADDHRPAAEVAAADVVPDAPEEALRYLLRGGRDRVRAHTGGSGAVCGIPETFVGTPAVIACTTSCCVVCLRS